MRLVLLIFTLISLGCSKKMDIEKELREKPEIVFKLIEDNPEKFIDSVKKASQKAKNQHQKSESQVESGFNNLKNPSIDESRVLGEKSAIITIVEYTDFECPFCSRGSSTMSNLKEIYKDNIKVVIKHLPLSFHPNAKSSATYFEAIRLSHSLSSSHSWGTEIFKKQSKFKDGNVESFYEEVAKELKLDVQKIKKVLNDPKLMSEINKTIEMDTAEAQMFDIQGTPGYIINGVTLKGAYPLESFKQIIDRQLKR